MRCASPKYSMPTAECPSKKNGLSLEPRLGRRRRLPLFRRAPPPAAAGPAPRPLCCPRRRFVIAAYLPGLTLAGTWLPGRVISFVRRRLGGLKLLPGRPLLLLLLLVSLPLRSWPWLGAAAAVKRWPLLCLLLPVAGAQRCAEARVSTQQAAPPACAARLPRSRPGLLRRRPVAAGARPGRAVPFLRLLGLSRLLRLLCRQAAIPALLQGAAQRGKPAAGPPRPATAPRRRGAQRLLQLGHLREQAGTCVAVLAGTRVAECARRLGPARPAPRSPPRRHLAPPAGCAAAPCPAPSSPPPRTRASGCARAPGAPGAAAGRAARRATPRRRPAAPPSWAARRRCLG